MQRAMSGPAPSRLLVSVLPLALLASPAVHGDAQSPQVEITMGILVPDTTCPKAQHALAAVCRRDHGASAALPVAPQHRRRWIAAAQRCEAATGR